MTSSIREIPTLSNLDNESEPSANPNSPDNYYELIDSLLSVGSKVIVGKAEQLKLSLCCLAAGGHLLIEDQPGVGKTTLAHLLSKLVGLEFQRLQFTSDMLPAEIIGAAIYDREDSSFRFHKGPIFTNLLLADEINRATPRAQSALLEAMEEQQVSAEGQTYPLPNPFFVIATQNPKDQLGTFPLPESQLDRFLMRISIGYPDASSERELLSGENRRDVLNRIEPVLTPSQLLGIQTLVGEQQATHALIDYVQKLLAYTRNNDDFQNSLSPRAGLGLLQAAKAWALFEKRDHVIPEDVQAVLEAVTAHRLGTSYSADFPAESQASWATNKMIEAVAIP